MEIFNHDDVNLVEILSGYFKDATLVPVLGAGFTVGEPSKGGQKVPNGEGFKKIMLSQLEKHGSGFSHQDIEKLSSEHFSEVADFYFDPGEMPEDVVTDTLRSHFYGVSLGSAKKSFLNEIEWKYIYTLNIDDAIESHSEFLPIYPYDDSLSDKSRHYKPVYKLHGDIYYELTHDKGRLVFRKASYLASIESNKRMLELLEEDMLAKNIIFLGCSLKDEDDIAYLVASREMEGKKETRRIVFSDKEPDIIEKKKLRRHGVNTIIIHEKGEFWQIYDLIDKAYKASADSDGEMKSYLLDLRVLGKDESSNKAHIISGVDNLGMAPSDNGEILPYYYGGRSKEREVLSLIKEGGIVVLSGGRVSGKTLMARSVANSIADKSVYYINTGTYLDTPYLHKLISKKNSVIVFDAKTLDYAMTEILRKNQASIIENSTSILVVLDSDDSLMVESLSNHKLNPPPVVELSGKLSKLETDAANKKLKEVRCPAFKLGRNILDNIFQAYSTLGQNNVVKRVPKTALLMKLLYVLGVTRRFDGDWVKYLNVSHGDVDALVESLSPYLGYEKTYASERSSHAGYKLISHSDAWLMAVILEIYRARGVSWCGETLFNLYVEVSKRDRRLAIELSKFDSLNSVFRGDRPGASELILGVYDRLEAIWGEEPEFFVQKAKAYYNMYRDEDVESVLGQRLSELEVAASWAEAEGDSNAERNIRHISVLVSLRRAYENKFRDFEYMADAVDKTALAIERESVNSRYVKQLADGKLRGSLYLKKLLDKLDAGSGFDMRVLSFKDKVGVIRGRVDL
ncbi:SIR2 family protein [Halomonas organivorans]|uniref:SIR2-like domain-containing protein n=1 Tax=Halomonas organivorans TaxID=257772 RepID=A0A7W5BUL5_9GAMM|nr:SIR2 family protein [Halomonas organivorans]MBB3139335.1 hypothetical protein [Halomonas organivorans]